MSVFAKSMSNGYPMGAVVGSREAMAPSEKAFISSSYWSDNVGLAASLTTIRELRRRDSTARFKQIGEDLRVALEHAIESVGVPVRVTGLHTRPTLQFDVPDGTLRGKVETLFVQEMALRGIHCYTGFMATLAHTQEDIRITADAAAESFKVVMAGLEGDVDGLLKTRPSQAPFRRLVR